MSAPESTLAARTKPSMGVGWAIFWILLGVPIVAEILGFFVGPSLGAGTVDGLTALIGWGLVAVWLWSNHQARATWSKRNDRDYRASQIIEQHLGDVARRDEPLSDSSPNVLTVRDARVGEVSQHFDQRLSASVSGWLRHELGLHGWGAAGSVGNVGLGLGNVGISGSSLVNLDVSGVIRDDLSGDGFVAVLERDQPNGAIDTVRVIVPSEPACREYIANLMSAMGTTFGGGSHRDETLRRFGPQLAASFPCDVSHVSDQLRAILRQPTERRPAVSVVGEDLGASVMLGGAIRIGGDAPWQQLFSISRSRAILSAVEGFIPDTSAPALLGQG